MTRREMLTTAEAGLTLLGASDKAPEWRSEWTIVETATNRDLRFRDLPGKLATADAIFVGEQHDDPETHRVEQTVLQALYRRVGNRLTLAMEMFERDQQAMLDSYLQGKIEESTFTSAVKLWKNYPTDYRPLVEFARHNRIPVLGSNAPGAIVRQVSQKGLAALEMLPAETKPQVAAYITAPDGDEYARRFAAIIGQGHGDRPMDAATVRRFYEAQCVRDDTMAETIVRALTGNRVVLHINGSFHSDAGLGTAARVLWRKPLRTRLALIKVVATKGEPDRHGLRSEADYLVFVPATGA